MPVASKKSKSVAARGRKSVVKSQKSAVKTPRERLDELGIEVLCEFLESGESLASFCKAHGFRTSTVNGWIACDEARSAEYARAKEARADHIFESLDDVSERAVNESNPVRVQGLRLKADNIKWKLARMHRKYSDRTVLSGDPEAPLSAPVDLSKLSDEDLQAYLALQRKLEGKA